MARTFLITVCVFLLSGCTLFESFSKGEKVAQAGKAVLYKSDVKKVVPPGVSGQDSLNLLRQYIDSWALKQLMLEKAEEQLPKAEKDVARELEEYRLQLLVYRYENKFIEERLDTLISSGQLEEYYNSYPDNFITRNGVVKARLIKIHNSSPNVQIIKNLASKRDEDSMAEFDELAHNSAYVYKNYNGEWTDLQEIAREMDENLEQLQGLLGRSLTVEKKDSSLTRILQVTEYIRPGEISPFEYNAGRIREIILSKRKQELISKLQKDILNEALDNRNFKIITENDKAAN